ncbi:MAG: putative CRISPR-associated protein [Spirochaetota bacterium]
MRNTLICTVGTSLFESNLRKIDDESIEKLKILGNIKEAFENQNWALLAKHMQIIDPKDRICGAEINTIEEARKKNNFALEKIFFLVFDTEDGKNTGKFLVKYYSMRKDLNLKESNINYIPVRDLQDKDPKKFKIHGLRNLVREIGKIVKDFGEKQVVIDATGGYKAQIAIAVIIGQALDIPVYYKHERFSEIIDFVPLPIVLNYDFLGKYSTLFNDLEQVEDNIIDEDELRNYVIEERDLEKIKIFLDEELIDGKNYYGLNAIGQLYLDSFRLRMPKIIDLPELKENEREEPTFRDDHYPDGFKEFFKKVWSENKWIKTCKTLPYDNQKSIKGIGFYVFYDGKNKKLVGTYEDRNNFGARFNIILSNEKEDNLNYAADILNKKYRKK